MDIQTQIETLLERHPATERVRIRSNGKRTIQKLAIFGMISLVKNRKSGETVLIENHVIKYHQRDGELVICDDSGWWQERLALELADLS